MSLSCILLLFFFLYQLDATKSPLALLAQTCLQIGKSDPISSTDSPNDSKHSERLKISNISFYSKSVEKKDSEPSTDGQCASRTQSATCRPFAVCSPKIQDEDEKNESDGNRSSHETSEMIRSGNSEMNFSKTRHESERNPSSSDAPVVFSTSSSLGLAIPPFSALPLPLFPRSCVTFPQPLLPALNNKAGPSIISTGPCGDPYCLGYHCASSLRSTFPFLYPSHSLPSSSTSAFTIFPHGLTHPHELQPCILNSVSAHSSETNFSSSVGSHMHAAPTSRSPHHTLGLGTRYHPYIKNPLPAPSSSYYSLHGLYGQRLYQAP